MQPPPTTEMHYTVQDNALEYQLSQKTESLLRLNPSLVLGSSNLFQYNEAKHSITISPSFRELLKLLVQIHELDPKALKTTSFSELNDLLQRPQEFQGGLLRREGMDRWDLRDSVLRKKFQLRIDPLFEQIGLCSQKPVSLPLSVDHCILFGARCEHMERRIKETVSYLENKLTVTQNISLLGSNRKLLNNEIDFLKTKINDLNETQKTYWQTLFDDSTNQTEANAFLFLWTITVPEDLQTKYKEKLILIQSTRLLTSCGLKSVRPTMEITAEDWTMMYYQDGKPQSIFALAEQPFSRLFDQLRTTILTQGKKATRDILIDRIKNTTFYFATPESATSPLISVTLDEIARHVFRMIDTVHYLETVE